MTLPLAFHVGVHPEVDEAFRWYEDQRIGLGREFLDALEVAFDRIRNRPKMARVVYRNVHRLMPRRFPYAVFYRPFSDRIEVVAVQHAKRHPDAWKSRL